MKIKKTLKELESIRGRHTELVSVYLPSGHSIVEMINQLSQEKSTASNIKSKATRKNVLDALEKIIQHLRLFRQTPPNGLIVFCGNISPVEGKTDLKLWSFEPSEKMNVKLYWCDQVFVLDPLKEMVREKEIYGLIVLDANEASVGFLKGKQIVQAKKMESTVPAKSIKGGMCLHEHTVVNNGEINKISKIKEGNRVLSFNFKSKSFTFSKVRGVKRRKAEIVFKIITDLGNEIVTTPEHIFFTGNLSSITEKAAEDIKIGDTLLSLDSTDAQKLAATNVIGKELIKADGYFFDLFLPQTANFVANGLLVHNSQMRYDRIRDDALNEFFTKVAEVASNIFLEIPELKGIIIGGPGPNKEIFFKNEYLNYQIQKKVLGVKDVGYTGEEGLEELVKRSEDLIKESKYNKEREILQKFFTGLQKNGNVVYGYENVRKALDLGAADTLLLSEDFSMLRVKFKCQCGFSKQLDIKPEQKNSQKCDNCGSTMIVDEEQDMTEILIKDAENFGTKVVWISVDTEEGRQFRNIGAIGAFLRYKISQ